MKKLQKCCNCGAVPEAVEIYATNPDDDGEFACKSSCCGTVVTAWSDAESIAFDIENVIAQSAWDSAMIKENRQIR